MKSATIATVERRAIFEPRRLRLFLESSDIARRDCATVECLHYFDQNSTGNL